MIILRYLSTQFERDLPRLFYWLPVALGLGVGWYFAMPVEPDFLLTVAPIPIAALGCFLAHRHAENLPWLKPVFLLLLFFALGVAAAKLRSDWVDARFLSDRVGPARITGSVLLIDRLAEGARIVLTDLSYESRRFGDPELPNRARIKIKNSADDLHIGDRVRVLALLSPPSEPALPDGYDFSRQLYFDGIGAVGFAIGGIEILSSGGAAGWRMRVNDLRDAIIRKVYQVLDGDQAAVAAALITSEQNGLTPDATQAMRQSGLQHVLSVSGLHLTLAGGLVFFVIRFLLIWVPRTAILSKKIAALAALAAMFFYLVISGFEVPTQRAFIMVGLVFTAILFDREGLSMRLVAVAAIFILLLRPESLWQVSFQLSFAAVVALISAYESWQRNSGEHKNWLYKIVEYFVLSAMTALIASLATAPLIAYHFHQLTAQSILANVLTSPLVTFWLMPLVVLSLLLMPFGLESGPLWLMGIGVDGFLHVAQAVAAMPGSQIMIPAISFASIMTIAAGALWLLLWLQPWRYLGLIPIAVGIFLAAQSDPPDILVNAKANLFGVKTATGTLAISNTNREKFTAKIWNNSFGQKESIFWRANENWSGGDRELQCDAFGCIYRKKKFMVAFLNLPEAFDEDCGSVPLIITALPAPENCKATKVLDQDFFKKNAATAIWISDSGWRIKTVQQQRGHRPWSGAAITEDSEGN